MEAKTVRPEGAGVSHGGVTQPLQPYSSATSVPATGPCAVVHRNPTGFALPVIPDLTSPWSPNQATIRPDKNVEPEYLEANNAAKISEEDDHMSLHARLTNLLQKRTASIHQVGDP
jgi:hypothetical protein